MILPRRAQFPAYSPVRFRGLVAGLGALFRPGGGYPGRAARSLQDTYGAGTIRLTDSGTSALALALRAASRGGRDPVALPAYGCFDLATAALAAGVRVFLYDLDPETLAPPPGALSGMVARGAAAVVTVHQYGIPADTPELESAAGSSGTVWIEDAAQGAGGALKGRPLAAGGAYGVLSFGRGKGMTTGAGGALLMNDAAAEFPQEVADAADDAGAGFDAWLRCLALWILARPAVYWIPASLPFLHLGETIFREPEPPRGLSRAAAAMLPVALEAAGVEAGRRRSNAAWLLARLPPEGAARIRVPTEAEAGYLRLPVLVPPAVRARADSSAARRLGIAGGYPAGLHRLPRFQDEILNREDSFPGTETLVRSLITLPVHSRLSRADLERIVAWL